MFRLEPAVAEFDGPFTPTHESREGIVGHQPLQASTQLSPRFTLLARRSLGFGSHQYDSPRLNTVALVRMDCGRIGFPVPAWMLQLGLPYKCTPWVVFQNARRDIGFPEVLLVGRPTLVFSGTLYAPSFYH